MSDLGNLLDNLQATASGKGYRCIEYRKKGDAVEILFTNRTQRRRSFKDVSMVLQGEAVVGYRLVVQRKTAEGFAPAQVSAFKINPLPEKPYVAALRITGTEGNMSTGTDSGYYWGSLRVERWFGFGISEQNQEMLGMFHFNPLYAFSCLTNTSRAFFPADLSVDYILQSDDRYDAPTARLLTDDVSVLCTFTEVPRVVSRKAFLRASHQGRETVWPVKTGDMTIDYLPAVHALDNQHMLKIAPKNGDLLLVHVPDSLAAATVEEIGASMGETLWYEQLLASQIPFVQRIVPEGV